MTESAISFGSVLPGGIDAVARGGIAASQAQLPAALRAVHQDLLREFLGTGRPPSADALGSFARQRGVDPAQAVADLAEADLVHLDDDGAAVAVAYPLSAAESGHQVTLDGSPTLTAMCAVDALGIPLMAGRSGTIDSTDPTTGQPIRVTCTDGEWTWEPASAVVVLAASESCGRIAYACQHTAFHADRDLAERHFAEHPEQTGRVLSQDEAVAMARTEFGSLLQVDAG